ncbi:MAG TPA: T9SS type A sorting domain-containing protein [bacterium]
MRRITVSCSILALILLGLTCPAAAQDSLNVSLVGQLYGDWDYAWHIAIQEGYAYLATGATGLAIVSVADPTSPEITSFYDTPGFARGVAVQGSYAYVADELGGLRVINISNPALPVETGSCSWPNAAWRVAISGDYAYVVVGFGGLRIVNISNPAAPVQVGYCGTPDAAYDVAVSGTFAYVTAHSAGLRVINVSNPTAPMEVGFCPTQGYAECVALSEIRSYVTEVTEGLRIIDISNPASPVAVGFCRTPSIVFGVAVLGTYAYTAAWDNGLRAINVTSPSMPAETGFYGTQGQACDVGASGDYTYVADGDYFGVYECALVELSITLIPFNVPIQIPANGGSFNFFIFANNAGATAITTTLWTGQRLPNGSFMAPILGPCIVNLEPGAAAWYRNQNVPGTARPGQYQYIGYAGTYPTSIWASDTLIYTKLSGGYCPPAGDWSNRGDLFPGEIASSRQPIASNFLRICPNPLNPSTIIIFELSDGSYINLRIYDTAGRLVETLVDGWRSAGTHELTFDASDLPSGLYFAKLEAGDYTGVQKMILVK